jgi:hypothetical protein
VFAAALLGIAAMQATPALAQRVFVAAQGSDANPCSFALPCRTFQHAHDTVAAGGEVDVLDPAGYGALTITKAISIQGHGFSGISVGSGLIGILINAGANDAINLNGLLIEGSGTGATGIRFNSGKSLVVENCVVRNLTQNGLAFVSTAASLQTLSASASFFTDNAGTGILIQTHGTGAVTAAVDHVGLYDNGTSGLTADGNAGTGALNVAVRDSIAAHGSGVGTTGFAVQSGAGQSPSTLILTRAKATGNNIGISATGTQATLWLAQSTVTGNVNGYTNTSAAIRSYGDNAIDDNGSNVGSLSSATKQ